jgi:predicted N-acetyltransferase YhbS
MPAPIASAPPKPCKAPVLAPERVEDAAQVAALIERAFGPGRYAKAAERLREHNTLLLDISCVAWAQGRLIGCVRMWPVHVGDRPAVFLGPFAVEPTFRSLGLGAALIRKAADAARSAGHDLILLVGDAAYFGPLGFDPVPRGRIELPGPVDPQRVLTMALAPGADADLKGAVRAG